MANPELQKYIESARAQHIPDEAIKSQLMQIGWSEADVLEAMVPQSQGSFMPAPPLPHFGMWVAFQYVLLFISLYVSAAALANIAHYWVNQLLKDVIVNNSYYGSSYFGYFGGFLWNNEYALRANAASLLVAFPILAILFLVLKRQQLDKPAVKNLKTRKVLIYITLVITFVIMLSRIIRTVYGFLSGTEVSQSLGHLAITLFVSGSIFLYFLLEVRMGRKS